MVQALSQRTFRSNACSSSMSSAIASPPGGRHAPASPNPLRHFPRKRESLFPCPDAAERNGDPCFRGNDTVLFLGAPQRSAMQTSAKPGAKFGKDRQIFSPTRRDALL